MYVLRESRSSSQRGMKVDDEDNRLQDGTLIDLCGATLLWRSAEGLAQSPVSIHSYIQHLMFFIFTYSFLIAI